MMRRASLFMQVVVGVAVLLTAFVQPAWACNKPGFNYECQRRRAIDSTEMCDLFCLDSDPLNPDPTVSEFFRLNLFGVTLRFDSERGLAQVIAFGFTVFLGIIALTAAAIGVMASIKRANAEADSDVQAAAKTMRNAIIGVVIAGMSILIVQLVASVFGLSIFDLANFNDLLPNR